MVLLDVSRSDSPKVYGYGFVVYDCSSLLTVSRHILGSIHAISRIMCTEFVGSLASWSTFVKTVLWGFSWKTAGFHESAARRSLISALEKSMHIVIASRRGLDHALDFLTSVINNRYTFIVCDSGREEVKCSDELAKRVPERHRVEKHVRYTPFLSLADYIAGIARYRSTTSYLNEWVQRIGEEPLRELVAKLRRYERAYRSLLNRLRTRVREFV